MNIKEIEELRSRYEAGEHEFIPEVLHILEQQLTEVKSETFSAWLSKCPVEWTLISVEKEKISNRGRIMYNPIHTTYRFDIDGEGFWIPLGF